ncbi:hypothetical protein NEOLI_004378 [Neolecta irregularis DAH-3]|uniref:Retrotransposon gag domain-containing protein n=1 Tax=Neolecta irregularis (strain DAH-3) TaxID=1198029 RepID=A0A1U7LNJ7_NEOID|nr:hypothetical protein NEOLI_004378 [Neolecta irregularis DAH-3]|eukprot:OLL24224.1 hypothetical protein NEOLI_004378 [Neolecta irregularis DAH-3]
MNNYWTGIKTLPNSPVKESSMTNQTPSIKQVERQNSEDFEYWNTVTAPASPSGPLPTFVCREPPTFSGNPHETFNWITRMEIFFDIHSVPDSKRVFIASTYLEADAFNWFSRRVYVAMPLPWNYFRKMFLKNFEKDKCHDCKKSPYMSKKEEMVEV